MGLIELQEQKDVTYPLDADEVAELKEGKCLDIQPSCENNSQYDLNPGPWVGTIQLPTLTVRITPKLPVSRAVSLVLRLPPERLAG